MIWNEFTTPVLWHNLAHTYNQYSHFYQMIRILHTEVFPLQLWELMLPTIVLLNFKICLLDTRLNNTCNDIYFIETIEYLCWQNFIDESEIISYL